MRFGVTFCLSLLFAGVISVSTGWAQSPKRTWHAASGGFKVEAELVDVREDKVQLKKADGTTTWVELQKLSLADIQFVQETLEKARKGLQKKLAEDPKKSDPKGEASTDTADVPDAEMKKESNDQDALEEEKQDRLPGWDIEVESSGTKSPFAGIKEVHLVLGQASPHDLIFPATPSTWVAVQRLGGGGMAYQAANIRTGKMHDPFKVDGFGNQKALSPDGASFAMIDGFPAKVTIYSTSNGKKGKEFNPAEVTSISKIFFLSPQQLLILGQGIKGVACIYDIKTGKAVKSIDLDSGFINKMALSPNAKILAIPSFGNTIEVYDLKSGKKKSSLAAVPVNGSGNLSITDIGFCRDGAELVVLGSATTGELHAFSMKTGRPTQSHVLSGQISTFCPNHGSYVGPPVEALSGNKGWVLYGSAIVDRIKGGPIWNDNKSQSGSDSPFRVLIDDNKQLALVGNHSAKRFEVISLPWSEISKSKETVEKGGTVEDTGLPAVVAVAPSSAPLIQTALNPSPFAGSRVAPGKVPKMRPVPLDKAMGFVTQAHFTSPSVAKCIAIPTHYANNKKMALVLDLEAGKVEKSLDTAFASQIHGLSPDARWMVTTTGKNNDRVDLFDVKKGKHAVGFRPSTESDYKGRVQGVTFVGNDLLLTVAGDQQGVVWEIPGLKPLYRFTTVGVAFPFPNSSRFVHRNEQGWVVRSSVDGSIEGTLEGSLNEPNEFALKVSILEDESKCIALVGLEGQQKLIVWDLLTGKRMKEIAMSSVSSSIWSIGLDSSRRLTVFDTMSKRQLQDLSIPSAESLSWCNQDYVLMRWNRNDTSRFADPRGVSSKVYSLVSIADGRILWDYRIPNGMALEGGPQGQIWFTEQSTNGYAMVGVDVPSAETKKQLDKAPQPKSLISKGESLVLDVQVNISGDKLADGFLRDQVVAAISQNLKNHGIESSERAGIKLEIRVDQVVDRGTSRGNFPVKMLASCRLTDISKEVLWQRDKMVGAVEPNQTAVLADDLRKKEWENVLGWLKQSVDPATMYEKWYYRGLGESLLSSSGEKLIETKVK